MRILVYSVVGPRGIGGAEAVIGRFIRAWREGGHEVVFAGPEAGRDDGEWKTALHLRPNGRVWHLPSLARLATGLARLRPNIVNVHMVTPEALYFAWLKSAFGYRLVLSTHGSDLLQPPRAALPFLPRLFRAADAVTAVSDALAQAAVGMGVSADRVVLTRNGVDVTMWGPSAPRVDGPPSLAAVGRLHPVKGFDVLIEAFALVRQARPDARLCIVGDGELREPLINQVRALGLEGSVDMPGALDSEGVRERLEAANLFVLPSLSEGMSLALLEAMACGLPVFASAVGGVPEVVTPDCGVLVTPRDPRGLADAILQAIADGAKLRSMGEAARRRAEALSWDATDAAYEALFERLAA